jgi:hypothetical protein
MGLYLYKIVDCARMRFSSVRNRRSARTGRRPRKRSRGSSNYPGISGVVKEQPLRAARANPVFGTDEQRIRTKNTVINKSNNDLRWVLSKIADCVRMCFSSARNR